MPPVVDTRALGPTETNCSVVPSDETATSAVVIDAGYEGFEPGYGVAAILLTHTHFDHIGAVAELVEATGAPVYVPAEERFVLAQADEIYRAYGVAVRPWDGDVIEL